jgi:hypothetical protein
MPQLINVLQGEMSIVGPPLCRGAGVPRSLLRRGAEVRRCRGEFSPAPVPLCTPAPPLPGSSAPLHKMASPAFIQYRHEEELLVAAGGDLEDTYLTAILPDKLRLDLEYIEQQSFLSDLTILAQAALSLFTTAGPEQRSRGAGEQGSGGDEGQGSN